MVFGDLLVMVDVVLFDILVHELLVKFGSYSVIDKARVLKHQSKRQEQVKSQFVNGLSQNKKQNLPVEDIRRACYKLRRKQSREIVGSLPFRSHCESNLKSRGFLFPQKKKTKNVKIFSYFRFKPLAYRRLWHNF